MRFKGLLLCPMMAVVVSGFSTLSHHRKTTTITTPTTGVAASRRNIASSSSATTKLQSSASSSSSTPETAPIDEKYFVPAEQLTNTHQKTRITLTRFLAKKVKANPDLADLENIALAIQMACKTISNLVHRAGLNYDDTVESSSSPPPNTSSSSTSKSKLSEDYADGRYYSMKRLDKLSTNVLKNALKFTGTVKMLEPQAQLDQEQPDHHQPGVLIAYDEHYCACLDPLDGSGNADASICTGTIFGIFRRDSNDTSQTLDSKTILQPARNMRAAGYCLYSSATVLVFTFQDDRGEDGVYGFTLDPQTHEFVLTHDNLTIPDRGTVYSCNEANSEGWDDESGWKPYLKKLKLGHGETQTRYAHRYVGSMVGDIHRTLLYGGIFAYPSSDKLHKPRGNLQLLYKVSPMAFVVHHAGGKALDEQGNNLLDKKPERIHQKSPCFMGSPGDVDELAKYLPKPTKADDDDDDKKEDEEAEAP